MTEEASLEATAPMPWRQAVMTVPLVRIATLLAAAAGLLHGCSAGYVPVFLGLLRNMAAASGPAAMDCPVSNASSAPTGDGIVPSSCFEGSGDGTIEWSTMQQGLFAAAHVVGAFIGPLVVGRVITFVTDRVARSEDLRAAKTLTAGDGHEGSSTLQHRNDNNNSADLTGRNSDTIHQTDGDTAASSSIDVALVPFHAATKAVIACLFAGVALMALGRGVRQYAVLLLGRIAWGMGSGGMRFVAPLFAYAVAEEHIARQITALIEPATQLGIALNVAYGLVASRGFFLGTPTAMEVGIQGTNAVDALFALGLCALLRYLIAHSRVPASSSTVGEPNENAAAEDEIEKASLIPAGHDATHRPPLNAAIVAAADNASFTSVTAVSLRGIALPPSDWLNGGPSAPPPQAPPALRFDLSTPPSMLPPRSHGKSVSYDLPPAVSALSVDHKPRDGAALPAAASMERQQHSSHGQRTGGDMMTDPHTHNTHNTHSHLGVGAASYGTAAQHRIHSLRRLINHMASPLTCAADAPPVARSFTTASYGTITAHGTPSMMSYAAHHQRSFGRTPMQHPQRNGMAPVSAAAFRAQQQQHQDPNALYPQPHEQPRRPPHQVLGGKSAVPAALQPPHSFLESMEMKCLTTAGQNPHGDLMSLGTDMTFITPLPTPAAADAPRLPVSLPTSSHKSHRQESQRQGMAEEGDDVDERCSPSHSLLDHRSPAVASGASHGPGDHGLFPSTPLVSIPDLQPVAQSSPSGADHVVTPSSPQEAPPSIGQRELTTTAVFEAANDNEDETGAGEGMSCVVVQEEVSDLHIEHVSLFTKVTRLLLGFVVAAPFILTGSTGLASYMTTYGDAIYGVPNMAAPFVLCGTALPFGVLGIALKRWVSARKLMLIGCVGVSVGQATIGTAALPGVVASTSASNTIALLGAIVFVASHQACVGASFFELAISIMPVPMRGLGSSVLSAVVAVYAVAVNFTFPLLVASLGAGDEVRGYALCCYGFAAIGVLSFVILFVFMHPIPVKG